MQWAGRLFRAEEVAQYQRQLGLCRIAPVFGHTGYLINLAAAPGDIRDRSIQSLIQEIQLATQLDLPFLVLHPGAHLGAGEEAGLQRVVAGLNAALAATRSSRVRVALENTAGQGSCLGCALSHLAEIYERVEQPERLGICLDTAHLFAAGYDIRTRGGWDATIEEVDRLIGLNEVCAFHLNDSKTTLRSRVDRHAHIGQGFIGREAFRHIVNDARFQDRPACLETPKSKDLHEDVENLTVLRSLLEPRAGSRRRSRGQPRVGRKLARARGAR